MAKDHNRCFDKPGPLLKKQSKDARGSGKTVEAESEVRRKAAKERERQAENFVLLLKIHLGRQSAH